ncbi:arylsulfatase [Haloferula helveola]|uniref:Arylsulfatase n=1 Tax=Haloferula helveola TaxID=490095 RepID=A0ABN6H3Z4_9BACT|nr:arylsulfatase [Haloferula helveola]
MIRCILALLFAGTWCHAAEPAPKPNAIVILLDDLGYGDLTCYGAKDMRTPRIDTLMSEGIRMNRFYANCTVCTPTRASLMTGRYPDLAGAPGVIRQWDHSSWGYLRPPGPTLPEMLKSAGYHTGMVGKWHLGYTAPNVPNEQGFDHFHGFLGDMMDDYYTHRRGGVNWMRLNDETVDPEGHATEVFTDWAIDYLGERAKAPDTPFFLYLAYNAPHFPIQPPKDWLEKVRKREPDLDPKRAANVAFVEHTDHEIGRVLDSLTELNIKDQTLVIFSSDNGGSIPHAQSNGDLRGGKQDHWEGGIRVPTCAVWPGKIPAGKTTDALGMTMDLVPTLCELAGAGKPESDGQSLRSVWLDGGVGDPDRTMIWVRREGGDRYGGRAYYAIRRGKWKLLQNHPFEPMQMVDLEADPFEQDPKPATGKVAKQLKEALMAHIRKAGAVPWKPMPDEP